MKINNYLYIQNVNIFMNILYNMNVLKSLILNASNIKINTYIKMLVKTYLLNYK